MLQRTLKNYQLWKKIQSALNQRTLIFFQPALISAILTHFEKEILHGSLCLFCFKILKIIIHFGKWIDLFKCFIDYSNNCTFICQVIEVILLHGMKGVCIMQIKTISAWILSRFIGNYIPPLPDSFGHNFAKIIVF